jgi:hypothetical protein
MRIRAKPTIASILVLPAVVFGPIVAFAAAVCWKNRGEWEFLAASVVLPVWWIVGMLGQSLELKNAHLSHRRWFVTVFEIPLSSITDFCMVNALAEAAVTASLPGRMHLEFQLDGDTKTREILVKPFALADVKAIKSAIEDAIRARAGNP